MISSLSSFFHAITTNTTILVIGCVVVSFGKGMPKGRVGSGSDDARGRPSLNCDSNNYFNIFYTHFTHKSFFD